MNKSVLALVPLVAALLSACVMVPAGRGPGVSVGIGIAVPALPLVVEMGSEPYYQQGGYTYFYDQERWRYAQSRSGPWQDLPQSHYPREIRYGNRGDGRERDGRRDDVDRGRGH